MRDCEVRDLGCLEYDKAARHQHELVQRRKQDLIPDQLLFVEHPHVVTMGRNGHIANLLAGEDTLARAGILFYRTDRGGDVTYHGPGQVVGYPIIDLKQWKRDVVAYVRALEEVLIRSLSEFDVAAERANGHTGVWVSGAKIAAIGVHISRWITSHGFALNVNTDLRYFQYIVPCGRTKPVTSLKQLGRQVDCKQVQAAIIRQFACIFGYRAVSENTAAACSPEPAGLPLSAVQAERHC
ncbi:lipoyl(octanoyl) transferase LipB [Nitrospirales bacterium NOB]|nr:lipoyl(octanoyl) transferase LipB [Nitrospirales bacterium NOB]